MRVPAASVAYGVLCIAFALTAISVSRAADPKIDVEKLKPGDKLEVEEFGNWIPAEFDSKISDQLIKVKRADWPVPVGAPVSRVRIARGAAARASTPDDGNPFATPEEKLAKTQARRMWSDESGKFKIEATLVRIDGTDVVLRRGDDKTVTVPIGKLSHKDQAYLATTGQPANKTEDDPPPPPIKITPTDVQAATQVNIQPDAAWTYKPAAPAASMKLAPVQIALRKSSIHERPVRMLFLPQDKKAFVVLSESLFSRGTMYSVQACDLSQRSVGATGKFGVDLAPIAISPDGLLVLARTQKWGFGGEAELQLYQRKGNEVQPLSAWRPFQHHTSPFPKSARDKTDDPSRPALWHGSDVTWAEFLDAHHVMTAGAAGEVAVWRLPEIEPVYFMPSASVLGGMFLKLALSSDKSYFALPTKDGIAIVRAGDGETAGFLPADMPSAHINRLAWRDDGKQLALFQHGRVRVWDLTSRELTRDFALDTGNLVQSCDWADDKHLLLNGNILVDVERRIPVAIGPRAAYGEQLVVSGVLWTMGTHSAPAVMGVPAMPKNLRDPAPGKTAEQLLVIRPGIEVQLELPPGIASDGSDPRASVIERLKDNGVKVVDRSNIQLIGTLTTGETKQVKYTTFHTHQALEASVTEQVLTLSYNVDGETVWKHEARLGAPHFVQMNQGETIDQAIARVRARDGMSFTRVWIPAYVARARATLANATAAN